MPQGAALVTGASSGIGAAIAAALAQGGWNVGINHLNDEAGAHATLEAVKAAGTEGIVLQGNVLDPALDLFTPLEERFGAVGCVVNNAGITADGLAIQMSAEDWDRVIATNLTAAFRLTQQAVRRMARQRHGRVVNIASIVGQRANAGQANYAAAKAGLIGMTKTVAVEVARRGVTVNAVAPGFIDTAMAREHMERALEHVPARRAGKPEEVAAAVRFLASDDAAYITGTTLFVDGGMSA